MQTGLSVLDWQPLQGFQPRSLSSASKGIETVRAFYRHSACSAKPPAESTTPPVFGFLDVTCIGRFGDGRDAATDKGIFSRWPVESDAEQRQGSANHHTKRRVDCLKCRIRSEPRRDGDADVVPRKSDSVCVERSRARALPAAVNVKLWACFLWGLPRGSRVSGTPQARPSRAPPYSSFQYPCQTNYNERACDGHTNSSTPQSN
jgi:hypothetical protein